MTRGVGVERGVAGGTSSEQEDQSSPAFETKSHLHIVNVLSSLVRCSAQNKTEAVDFYILNICKF